MAGVTEEAKIEGGEAQPTVAAANGEAPASKPDNASPTQASEFKPAETQPNDTTPGASESETAEAPRAAEPPAERPKPSSKKTNEPSEKQTTEPNSEPKKRPAPPKAPPPAHLLAAAREAQKKAAEEEAGVGAFDGYWCKEGTSTTFTVVGKDCWWPNGDKFQLVPLSKNECILHMKDKAFYGNLTPEGRCVWDNGSAWLWKGEYKGAPPEAPWQAKKQKAAEDVKPPLQQPGPRRIDPPKNDKAPGNSSNAPPASGKDEQDFPDRPKRFSIWGSKSTAQATPTKQKTAAEQSNAPPALSLEGLAGSWRKEGAANKYTIEGSNVHWLDSNVTYKLHIHGPSHICVNIEGVVYNAQVISSGPMRLKWNNGATWVQESGPTKAAPAPPAPAAGAAGASATKPGASGAAQASNHTPPPPPTAQANPPGSVGPRVVPPAGPAAAPPASHPSPTVPPPGAAQAQASVNIINNLHALIAAQQYQTAAHAQQQAFASQQAAVLAQQQASQRTAALVAQQAAQVSATAREQAKTAQQQAISSQQREADKIVAAAAAQQMASANAMLDKREATRGIPLPVGVRGPGDRMWAAANAALSATTASSSSAAAKAVGSSATAMDGKSNASQLNSASAKALDKLKKEDAKKKEADKRKGRGRSSSSSRRSRSRRRGKDKDRGRRSRDRRRSPKDKHRRQSGRRSRSRSRSGSRKRNKSPARTSKAAAQDSSPQTGKLSKGGSSAARAVKSKAEEEASAQLLERFRRLDLALDGDESTPSPAAAKIAKREDDKFDWEEFNKIKGRWVDDVSEVEPEEAEPLPEEEGEGAWGEEAPEPEKGHDQDLEGELEKELELDGPEAVPRATPSTAPRPSVPQLAASDDWEADEWQDVDLDAPAPNASTDAAAADDTEEEDTADTPKFCGAWVDSSNDKSELQPSAKAEEMEPAFDPRRDQLGAAEEDAMNQEESRGYDHRIDQAGVVEESQVAVRQDPRCVRIVAKQGPVNLIAAVSFCSGFGEVVAMRLEQGSDGQEAVIDFRTEDSAQACLDLRENDDYMILPRSIDDSLL